MIKDDGADPEPYKTRDEGFADGVFLRDPRTGDFYKGIVDYGNDPLRDKEPLGAPGFWPDLTLPKAKAWWGRQYTFLLNAGLEMVWQDETDPGIKLEYDGTGPNPSTRPDLCKRPPGSQADHGTLYGGLIQYDFGRFQPHVKIHNAYAQSLLEATSQGIDALRPGKRNFVIARGGYAGLQRYAGIWTGDSVSDWGHYQANIPMVLGLGLSGVPISGSDIGGFASGQAVHGGKVDSDLLIRWMTLGAFLPWYRNHYTAYDKTVQEPYNYPEVPEVLIFCRKYVELRYRLLPYFYDALWTAHRTGLPIARPLLLHYPADASCYEVMASSQEFLVGDSLLVAPVLLQGALGRTVYVPKGDDWYPFDLDSKLGAQIPGGTWWLQTVGWDVPVYVKAGAIVPVCEIEQFVGEKEEKGELDPLTVQVWPGPDRTCSLFLDDGVSTDYLQGKFRETEITTATAADARTIRFRRVSDGFTPKEPFFFVRLVGQPSTTSVTINGANVPKVAADEVPASPENAYGHDATLQVTTIKIVDNGPDLLVRVAP
jgi:alpha-glucosidase